jgi:hypothetical protein
MMSGRRLLRTALGTVLLAVLLVAVEVVVHEVFHAVVNYVAAGRLASCGGLPGPFHVERGQPRVCFAPGGWPAVNSLVVPTVMGVLGVVAMQTSNRLSVRWQRWGVFYAGVYAWLVESLYAMGYWTPPTLTASGVVYAGDGATALDAFGRVAQFPPLVVFVLGFLVLLGRVRFQRSSGV